MRYFSLLHVFRVKMGCGPQYLHKGFIPVADVHNYQTRASGTGYHISREDVDGSFVYFGKKEWNGLPDSLKKLGNLKAFKVRLKRYFLESY